MNRHERGVTLLHLLVAVAIIGVVVAVAMALALSHKSGENERVAQSDIQTLARAIDMYQLDTGSWPTKDDGLESLVFDSGKRGWQGPYVKSRRLPVDPWGNAYRYDPQPDDRMEFKVFSPGPDGEAGTGDDIGNWKRT